MGKRDKSTPRKRGGNDVNGAYPFKPVKIRIMKVASLFFFICSCSLFVVFVVRLSLVPFEEYPRVKVLIDYVHNDIKAYQKILAWWGTHIDETSARTLLPVMGIFNFTYTQILAARGQRFGIRNVCRLDRRWPVRPRRVDHRAVLLRRRVFIVFVGVDHLVPVCYQPRKCAVYGGDVSARL